MAIVDRSEAAWERHQIPHETDPETGVGEWGDLCKMTHTEMEHARGLAAQRERKNMGDFGGDVVRVLGEAGQDAIDKARAKAEEAGVPFEIETDPYAPSNFDRNAVLEFTVRRWSYSDKVSRAQLRDLDEPTAAFFHETAVAMSRPATQEEEKNS